MSKAFDQFSPVFVGFDTDDEDFTRDIKSALSESSSDEEKYVVAIRRDAPFDPDMILSRPENDDITDIPNLPEESEDSESEREKE